MNFGRFAAWCAVVGATLTTKGNTSSMQYMLAAQVGLTQAVSQLRWLPV